jgi:hypothetical protein
MAEAVHPLTGQVRRIRGEEVAQARLAARAAFEKVLPGAMVPEPPAAEMDRWWPR